MANVTQPAAQQYGSQAVGKVLGRIGYGGDMHIEPAHAASYTPPVVLEIKIGEETALSVPITGFDLLRQQAGPHGTRITLVANEPS